MESSNSEMVSDNLATEDNNLIKIEDLENVSDIASDTELYTIDDDDEIKKETSTAATSESSYDITSSLSEESNSDSSDFSGDDINEDEESENDIIIKSKNEMISESVKDISDIKDIEIDVTEQKNMRLGKIYKKIKSMRKIIIESDISGNEYVIDTSKAILFALNDNNSAKVLGYISEIFGPVTRPYYTIAFEEKNIDLFDCLDLKDPIYVLIDDNFKLIKTSNIKLFKGSDASNFNDEEVDDKDMEFSDDEKEQSWKKQQKLKRSKKNKQLENESMISEKDRLDKGYISRGDRRVHKNTNDNNLITEENLKTMDINKLKVILGPAVLAKEKPAENKMSVIGKSVPQNTAPQYNNPAVNSQFNTLPNTGHMPSNSVDHHHMPQTNDLQQQMMLSHQFPQHNNIQYTYPQQPYGGNPMLYQQQQYPYFGAQQIYPQQTYNPHLYYNQPQVQSQVPPPHVSGAEQQAILSQLNQLSPEQLKDILEKAQHSQQNEALNNPNIKIRKWNQK